MTRLYLSGFILALLGSLAMTPVSIVLARRFRVMDMPGPRKIHTVPKPRWGGIGIACGVLFAIAILSATSANFRDFLQYWHQIFGSGLHTEILSLKNQLIGITAGSCLVFLVGAIDDKYNLNALTKLLVQIIAAYVVMMYGVRITGLSLPTSFGGYVNLSVGVSQLATIGWIIMFTNSMNLVDGIDGLAAGLAVIVAGTFFIVAMLQMNTNLFFISNQLKLAGLLAAVICGASLGFLVYNFHPAKVFMGDGGSMFVGFLLGSITVIGTLKSTALVSFFVPLIALGHPVAELIWTVYRRFRSSKNIFSADHGHLHHLLLSTGWTQREIILTAYVIGLILSMSAILLTVFRGMGVAR